MCEENTCIFVHVYIHVCIFDINIQCQFLEQLSFRAVPVFEQFLTRCIDTIVRQTLFILQFRFQNPIKIIYRTENAISVTGHRSCL